MTVPPGAKQLLDFIASFEAPHGYGTVYANKQRLLPKPITSMTINEVIAAGPTWSKRFGSSACGRYQFMCKTLDTLRDDLKLTGGELLDPEMQDRLGYELLKRRGFDKFLSGSLPIATFGLKIAQEWASFPVLTNCQGAHRKVARGQSYYAGDGLNKSLVKPEAVESVLEAVLRSHGPASIALAQKPVQAPSLPPDVPAVEPVKKPPVGLWARLSGLFRRG